MQIGKKLGLGKCRTLGLFWSNFFPQFFPILFFTFIGGGVRNYKKVMSGLGQGGNPNWTFFWENVPGKKHREKFEYWVHFFCPIFSPSFFPILFFTFIGGGVRNYKKVMSGLGQGGNPNWTFFLGKCTWEKTSRKI